MLIDLLDQKTDTCDSISSAFLCCFASSARVMLETWIVSARITFSWKAFALEVRCCERFSLRLFPTLIRAPTSARTGMCSCR